MRWVASALVLLLVAGSAAGQIAFASDYGVDVSFEARESAPEAIQFNCVASGAGIEADARCPSVATGAPIPVEGVRVLDATVVGEGPAAPGEDLQAMARDPERNQVALAGALMRGSNHHRATGGAAPDAILPGRAQFIAWHGHWGDANADAAIEIRWKGGAATPVPQPGNEWSPATGATLVTYVEPGSHPAYLSWDRPHTTSPDVRYAYSMLDQAYRMAGEADPRILFVDGSLFRSFVSTTVTDAILAPDPEGDLPFTPVASSLIDVDRYPAIAPGPVATVYGSLLGPPLESFGSPSVSACPNACRAGPAPAGTPFASEANRALWSEYPREWDVDSQSTNAGRWNEGYRAGYEGWIDLLPLSAPWGGPPDDRSGPLLGANADGSFTMAPGTLSFEAWTGVWKDLDGDGYVGAGPDAAERAARSRPMGDDYWNSRGEFFGRFPVEPNPYQGSTWMFKVTLTPITDWGTGVIVLSATGVPKCPPGAIRLPACLTERPWHATGATPIVVELWRDSPSGRYAAVEAVFMPEGSPGFTACTETLKILHHAGGFESIESLRDCDTIEPYRPL